jgi:hypothetical protein
MTVDIALVHVGGLRFPVTGPVRPDWARRGESGGVCDLTDRILTPNGYRSLIVANGPEALALAAAHEGRRPPAR